MTEKSGGAYYKTYPKSCAADDFWAQVGRTVGGVAVPQAQIDLIVARLIEELDLAADDLLLDLCCGNGALTTNFFTRCAGGVGVDFSDYLIDVAKRHFSHRAEERYVCTDALHHVATDLDAEIFTKVLCYGAFQYFDRASGRTLLATLRRHYSHVSRLVIGNLPDRTRLAEFYRDRPYTPGIEDSAETPIGIWWAPDDFARLAAESGWRCQTRKMPEDFYAAHYRFDAVLAPA